MTNERERRERRVKGAKGENEGKGGERDRIVYQKGEKG